MKKFKLLAIFLIGATIGLAAMSKSSVNYDDAKAQLSGGSALQNVIYVSYSSTVGSNGFTKYTSNGKFPQDILDDINSIKSNISGYIIYVRDYSMYQRLRSLGATDVTNSSDDIVKYAKGRNGYNIYMVRF